MNFNARRSAVFAALLCPSLANAQIVIGPVSSQQVPVDSPWLIVALAFSLCGLAIKFRRQLSSKASLFSLTMAAMVFSQMDWVETVNAASGSNETISTPTTQTFTLQGSITTIANNSGIPMQVKSINFQIDDGVNPVEACTQELSTSLSAGTVNCQVGTIFQDGESCYLECRTP